MSTPRLRLHIARVGRRASRNSGEQGFVLLEEIVSISLLMIVMAALATFFLTVTDSTTYQRARQSAVQLSNTEMNLIRGMPAADLTLGRDSVAQFAAAPAVVQAALATMAPAGTASASPILLPTTTATRNTIVYTISNYLGSCVIAGGGGSGAACDSPTASATGGVPYLRAVVAVTWPGRHCSAGLCSYVTSSLISAAPDPRFSLDQAAPPAPLVATPGNQITTVGATVSLALALRTGTGVAPTTWAATGLPAGLTISTTGVITGTPTTVTAAGAVTVTATDAFLRTATVTFTWAIVKPPTVTGLTTPFITTAGAAIGSQPLPYTCPAGSCTYSLAGAPSGIGLAKSRDGIGAATQTVDDTGGTLYLVGTVAASTAPSSTAYVDDVRKQGATNYWRLNETSGSAATDSIGGNPLLEQPGVGHGAAGALLSSPDMADTFDGATNGFAATQTAITGPQTFSESVWFNTKTATGGELLGFGNEATGTSSKTDRQLYMDNAGHVSFGVCGDSCPATLTTSGTYNDGQWHQVVGTLSGAGLGLYVDGSLVATNPSVTTAQAVTGYWRLGGDNLDGWPGMRRVDYLHGAMDDVSIYPTALSPAQIRQQYADSGRVPFTVTVTPTDRTTGLTGLVNTASWTVDSPPTVIGLTDPFTTTGGVTIAAQTLPYNCPLSSCSYSVSGAPNGIGLSLTPDAPGSSSVAVSSATGSIYLVGTVDPGTSSEHVTVTVTPTDTASGVNGPTATAAWTVFAAPTVSGLTDPFSTTVGAVIGPQSLDYSCPRGTCTVTLDGAPAGIGLSPTPDGSAQPSVAVTTTSGPLYLVGTVCDPEQSFMCNVISGSALDPGQFSLTATIQDTASQINGVPATADWTVYPAPSVNGGVATTKTTAGALFPPQPFTLSYVCPTAMCTLTLTGAPAGLGLSLTADGSAQPSLAVTDTSGNLYLVGTVNADVTGTFMWGITVQDTASQVSSTGVAQTLSVYPPPSLSGLTDPFGTTVGATITAQTLSYSCPIGSCTFTISGVSGVGLSTYTGGAAQQSIRLLDSTSGKLYVVGGAKAVGTFTLTVIASSSSNNVGYPPAVNGPPATAAWTVYPVPTLKGLTNPVRTTVGATVAAQTLSYSCPTGICTVALTGAPAGIGLSLTTNGSPQASVAVNSTSGTVYLVGTVSSAAAPGGFPVAATIQDTASRANGTAATSAWWVYAVATVSGLTNPVRTAAGAPITAQTLSYSCPIASCTYTVGGVAGVGLATSANGSPQASVAVTATSGPLYLVGVPATTGTFTLTVTGSSSGVNGAAVTAAWTVYAAPSVTGLTTPFKTTVGATITAQSLSYTCPAGTCSFAVSGAPSGIGLALTSGGAASTSVSPSAASGTIYLVGTVGTAVTPGNFTVTVTPKDTSSGATATATTAAWTVYATPSVTGLATTRTTVGATISQALTYTCPIGSCAYTLGGVSGIGLSASSNGTPGASVAITSTSGTLYVVGSPTTTGTFTLTVTGNSSGVNGTAATAAWTVYATPSVTGLTTPFSTTLGATITAQTLNFTCPAAACSYAVSGAPAGVGLSTTSNGSAAASVSMTMASGSIYLVGTAGVVGSYTVKVTPTDTVSGVNGPAATAVWTVYPQPTLTGLTSPFTTTAGATVAAQALPYTCPAAACTYTITGAPAGVGLSSSSSGGAAASVSVTGTSGSIYLVGTVGAGVTPGPFTVTVTPRDTASGVAGPATTASWTVYARPTVSGLTSPFATTVGATVAAQTLSYTCPAAACSYVLSGAPAGIGLSTTSNGSAAVSVSVGATTGSIYLVGTVGAGVTPGSFTVTVTPRDTASGVNGPAATAAWTVYARPSVNGLTSPFSTTVGATIAAQTLTYSCPAAACSYAVSGAPTGIGLSTTSSGSAAASVSVIGTTGSIYLVGTVGAGVTPGPFTVTVAPRDTTSGVAGSAATAAWTVSGPPTVTGLSALRTTVGATIAAQQLQYSCPASSCSYTVSGAPAGIGLSTTSSGSAAASVSVTGTSGSIYLVGTVGAGVTAGPFTVTVTPRDTASAVSGAPATATWTVYAPPSVSGLTTPFTTIVGATVAGQTLPYSCPAGSCTFTISGAPAGIGLSTTANGSASATVAPAAGTSGSIYLLGTAGVVGSYTVTITPTDTASGVTGPAATAAWTVYGPPSVSGLTTPFTTTAGATIAPQTLSFTCPAAACTYTLSGAPAGIGLSTTSNGSAAASVSVTGTSGSIYLLGTAGAAGSYSVTVTPKDAASGVTGPVATASWTVYGPPSVSGLTTPFSTTAGASIAAQTLSFTCPAAACSYAVSGAPAGVGLSSTPGGAAAATVSVSATSGSIYLIGTVGSAVPAGSLTVTVTPKDTASGVTGPAATAAWTVYGPPSVSGLTTPFTITAGASIAAQTLSFTCPAAACTYTLSGAPAGVGLSSTPGGTALVSASVSATSGSIYLVGTVGSGVTPGPFTVTVTPRDTASGVTGTPATAAWTVYGPPTVSGLTTPFTTTAGATIAAQTLSYTCPAAACTYAVSGAPAGIGVSTTSSGGASASVSVTAASGSIYLVGTVGAGATPGSFTVTVTPKDTASGVTGPVATASWTVLAAPSLTGLTALRTTVGATIAVQTLSYSCPAAACTYAVSGAPAGIGLSTTSNGSASASVSVTAASGSIYLVGTVGAGATPGSFTVTVTPKDTASGVTGTPATAAWTVYAKPTVSGLTTPFSTTVGATVAAQTLPYSCPTSTCTFTVSGAPAGIGLSATANGSASASVSPAAGTSGSIYLVGTAGVVGSYTVTVTPIDTVSGVSGPAATASWTVYSQPTVTGLTTPFTIAAGATMVSQSLPYTCPTSSCTYSVTGAPAGIGLSASGLASTGTSSVQVTATSGSINLVGTVSTTAPPGSYTVVVTPRDTAYGVTGPTATAAWTVTGATVTGLTTPLTATVGAAIAAQTLTYTCPSSACSFTVTGAPAGIGLAPDTVAAVSNVVTVNNSPSGSIYLRGTVGSSVAPGSYTVTVTPKDTLNNVNGPAVQAAWTVYAAPTVTGLAAPFSTTFGATITSQNLPFTCPSSSCTYTVAGAPAGIGLSTTAGGTASASRTVNGSTSGTLYLRGTVGAATASTSSAYTADVRSQGASNYWRLGEPSGSTGTDSIGSAPLTYQAGVGHGAAGAIAGSTDTGSTFDGNAADGAASTTTAVTGPQTFSESIWFNTTTTSGGRLLGFSNTLPANGISNNYDRQLYMDNAGHLYFGVCGSACPAVVTSSGGYNDGQWHHAVGTLSSAGQFLYIDGSLVASNAGVSSAQVFNGYWRLGGDNLNGWPGTISSQYFAGSLDEASVYPTALTATQVQQQWTDARVATVTVTVTPADVLTGNQGIPNQAGWTVYSPPSVTGLTTPFTTTAGAAVANQTLPYSCPTNTCTVALTGAPAGIGISTSSTGSTSSSVAVTAATGSVYLRGTVATSAAGPYTVAVTPTDTASSVVGTGSSASWTVNTAPTVTGLTTPLTVAAGATVATQTLPYTCQTASCTYTLAGAPAGVGLSSTNNGSATASVTVTAASGNIFLLGTVGSSVTPGSYSLSITSRDNGSGLTGSPATAAWTVGIVTVTGLTTPFTTAPGATIANQSLGYSCPAAACSYTLAGAPAGIGLSTATTGTVTAGVTTTGPGSGTIYLRGVVGVSVAPGSFTVTVTPKDTTDNVVGPANQAAWKVNAAPTVTGLTTPFTTTAGATITNQGLPFTCPSSSCTFSVSGAPAGIGLSATAGGTASASQTITGSTSGTLYLRGTVDPSAGTSSAYASDVLGQGATNYWRLADSTGSTGADAVGSAPLTESAGVGHGARGAIATSPDTASTFDGSALGTARSQVPVAAPSTFTEAIWFRTTTTQGGQLIGFGDSNGDTRSAAHDRQLYMDTSGRVIFGVSPTSGVTSVVVGTGPYNDGAWHQAVATMRSGTGGGQSLYLDGKLVGSPTTITTTVAYTGYWRLGGDDLAAWPAGPSSNFAGTLDEAAVYATTALTAAQVQQQWIDAHASTATVTVTPTDNVSAVTGTANQGTWTVDPTPTVSGLTTPFSTNPNAVVGNQTLPYSCPSGACTLALTGAPAGIGISTSSTGTVTSSVTVTAATGYVYLRGTVSSSSSGGYTVAVTPTDTTTVNAGGTPTVGSPSQATWTVNGPPTVTGLPSSASVSVGQVVGNIALTYTCPSASCMFTVGGGLSGIGLDTDAAGSTNSSVSTTTTGGTIYLRGTVTAAPGNYTVTITPTDSASGATGTVTQTAGTVYAAPTTGSPGTLSKANGTSISQMTAYSCPVGTCTVVISGYPAGVGLSTTKNTSSAANSTTSINESTGSGSFYIQGKPSAKGTYTVTVTITDANGSATSSSGTWTIT